MTIFGIDNSLGWGWWVFLSVIPLIIIYLIKPKPKDLSVPSLMFFTKAMSIDRERSFFRKLTRDWLFLLQLLILLLLSLFFVSPYLNLSKASLADHVVLVLDTSASSKVLVNGVSRFETMTKEALKQIGKSNTIILIGTSPKILGKEIPRDEAETFIEHLQPTDSRSSIGDALLLAGEFAKGEGDKVVVISDFMNTDGVSVEIAKTALTSKKVFVDFINVQGSEQKRNVGIVRATVDEGGSTVYVKNYDFEPEQVKLIINGETHELSVAAKAIEPFSFTMVKGITKVTLENSDDFMADNTVYLSTPLDEKIKVLYITNHASEFLFAALTSSPDVEVHMAAPPIIPEDTYDIYVIEGIDKGKIIAGTFDALKEKVEKGASLIIHAQTDIVEIPFGNLMPLKVGSKQGLGVLETKQINRFTKDVEFGSVNAYFATANEKGVKIVGAGDSSLVQLNKHGEGKVVYYGIFENDSDFKISPSYPVFWVNLLKFLSGRDEIKDLNYQTGDILSFETEREIATPSRTIKTQSITLDEAGMYEVGTKKIAVNLASESESDINAEEKSIEALMDKIKTEKEEEKLKYSLEVPLILLLIALIFLELLFVKIRGDV